MTRTREVVLTGGGMWPEDELGDTMIINMGPQHPSTHGVLRLMMELDGEDVLRIKPVIGYLHTGMEKTGEELSYVQGTTNVTRIDYASNFANELVYSLAVEKLMGVEVPPRAQWIRMMMCELSRMASHLLFQATNGMDIGAVSMMLYGWREREEVLRIFEYITGLRMNCNYIRPGGVVADLPDGWEQKILDVCDTVEAGVGDYDELLSENPIWRERTVGVGLITTDECLERSITGPILRSTGFAWDLRKSQPVLPYDEVDWDVIYTSNGDVFDRYRIRLSTARRQPGQCVHPGCRTCHRPSRCCVHGSPCGSSSQAARTQVHPLTCRTRRRRLRATQRQVQLRDDRHDRELWRFDLPIDPGSPAVERSLALCGPDDGGVAWPVVEPACR